MRELHRDHPSIVEQNTHAFHEVIQIWDMGENVISDQKICAQPLSPQRSSGAFAKKIDAGGDTLRTRYRRDILRRFDAKNRNVLFGEILQQISVIACDLDHPAVRANSESFHHTTDISLGVLQPRVAV